MGRRPRFVPTQELRDRVYAKTGRRCWYCGDYAVSIDHYFPRSRYPGIPDDCLQNLVPACEACNVGKGALPAEQAPALEPHKPWYANRIGLRNPSPASFGVETLIYEGPIPTPRSNRAKKGSKKKKKATYFCFTPKTVAPPIPTKAKPVEVAHLPSLKLCRLAHGVFVRHPRFGVIRVSVAFAIENPQWERLDWRENP